MAQDNTMDIQNAARAKLVEQRRLAVESIAKGRGKIEKHLDLLIKAQTGIDVLDNRRD